MIVFPLRVNIGNRNMINGLTRWLEGGNNATMHRNQLLPPPASPEAKEVGISRGKPFQREERRLESLSGLRVFPIFLQKGPKVEKPRMEG